MFFRAIPSKFYNIGKVYYILLGAHAIQFCYLMYELKVGLPKQEKTARTRQDYLAHKWRAERDLANEWYILAVFFAIRIIALLFDEVEKERNKVEALTRQLENNKAKSNTEKDAPETKKEK